jgi:hypothetical protein
MATVVIGVEDSDSESPVEWTETVADGMNESCETDVHCPRFWCGRGNSILNTSCSIRYYSIALAVSEHR